MPAMTAPTMIIAQTRLRNQLKSLVVVIVGAKVVSIRYVIGFVVVLQIQFDRIQADYDQTRTAFVARDAVSLLGLGIYKNFFSTFRAN